MKLNNLKAEVGKYPGGHRSVNIHTLSGTLEIEGPRLTSTIRHHWKD